MPRRLRAETYRARALRRSATPAERVLWELLRDRRLDGAKFRRQQPLGPYIVDFYCQEARLVVEADGAPHVRRPAHDVLRDRWLETRGLTVLRFFNQEILQHPDQILERLREQLRSRPSRFGRGAAG